MSIKVLIQERLSRSRRYVFIRADFEDIAGYDQVGRVLRDLVKDGELIKVGYGVYTKARKNPMTGKLMPAYPGGSDAVILDVIKQLMRPPDDHLMRPLFLVFSGLESGVDITSVARSLRRRNLMR